MTVRPGGAPVGEDAATSRWRESFAGCTSMLEALARTSDVEGRAAARAWWVICMGSRVAECKGAYAAWRAQAEGALPTQLKTEHTEAAISLPGFEPLAQCIIERAAAIGVDAGAMLDRVEVAGERTLASAEWSRAVQEVEPMRSRLQQGFLRGSQAEPSFLRRAMARLRSDEVVLASSAGEMGIDELRVCQVWMYGLASRLSACQGAAGEFAAAAGMSDPNAPLLGYEAERWDPRSPVWSEMEACVHVQAGKAGTEADAAWRRGRVHGKG